MDHPSYVPAEHRVALGVLSAAGAAILGEGLPDSLAVRPHVTSPETADLLAAGIAAQQDEEPPVFAMPAACAPLLRAVLDEGSIERATILMLDTGEARSRAALEELPWSSWPRVRYIDLEYVTPRVIEEGSGPQRLVGGLGLMILDSRETRWSPPRPPYTPLARLLPDLRSASMPPRIAAAALDAERLRRERADATVAALTRELKEARAEADRCRHAETAVTDLHADVPAALGRQVTALLRAAKRALRGTRR